MNEKNLNMIRTPKISVYSVEESATAGRSTQPTTGNAAYNYSSPRQTVRKQQNCFDSPENKDSNPRRQLMWQDSGYQTPDACQKQAQN